MWCAASMLSLDKLKFLSDMVLLAAELGPRCEADQQTIRWAAIAPRIAGAFSLRASFVVALPACFPLAVVY